jgi:hypothetical protein
MPWLFEAKKALTVEVRAPLPPHRDRPPSLAHVERPGNEGRYGPVGERKVFQSCGYATLSQRKRHPKRSEESDDYPCAALSLLRQD